MPKQITPISIKNRVFKINTLQVEAIAIKHFQTSFAEASKEDKAKTKAYIRELVKNKEHLSAQIIEDEIFLDLIPKNLQKELKSLAYMQGV